MFYFILLVLTETSVFRSQYFLTLIEISGLAHEFWNRVCIFKLKIYGFSGLLLTSALNALGSGLIILLIFLQLFGGGPRARRLHFPDSLICSLPVKIGHWGPISTVTNRSSPIWSLSAFRHVCKQISLIRLPLNYSQLCLFSKNDSG